MTTTVSATAQELKETAEDARKAIVDLHGEMVLLLNYSAINYTGCFLPSIICPVPPLCLVAL